ncbi:16S ribosomal RNA methyltransferase RsmE [Bordetella pertussis]|nr:16S ribosomal RNA methyltransferase RsmE [Bordetella pertussis]
MSLPRFYCDARLAPGECVALPEALAHHAVRVLRSPRRPPNNAAATA